jgi:hypothetical protein
MGGACSTNGEKRNAYSFMMKNERKESTRETKMEVGG